MAVEELADYTESILAAGSIGVVVRMVQAVQDHDTLQKPMVQNILKAFHVSDTQHRKMGMEHAVQSLCFVLICEELLYIISCLYFTVAVPVIMRVATRETFEGEGGAELPYVLNGALLLQAMWNLKPSVNDVFASRYVLVHILYGRRISLLYVSPCTD